MNSEEIKKLLDHYDDMYYNNDTSEITDVEYDTLKTKYLKITNKEEYDYVPGEAKFSKIKHTEPVLSLGKVQITDKVKLRTELERLWPFVIEPKFDGLTIVVYPGPKFVTRGNGKIGEDVTENCLQVPCMKNLNPHSFPFRMEAVMPYADFEAINKERAEADLKLYDNARNAAAGMLRNKEKKKVRGLTAFIYDVIGSTQAHEKDLCDLETQDCNITTPRWTFDTYGKEKGIEKAMEFIENFDRSKLNYDIDGLVVKSNIMNSLEIFGMTGHHPKDAIAIKFEAQGEWTQIHSVTWQIGKTGKATPVAEVEPTRILGSTTKRATLNNFSYMKALGLNIIYHDNRNKTFVKLVKANDVIPKVIDVRHENPDGTSSYAITIQQPKICPICGAPTKIKKGAKGKEQLYCTGEDCPAQLLGKIKLLSSNEALNIEGLSVATIEKMLDYYEENDLGTVISLEFTLPLYFTYENILALPGFAEVSAKKLYDNIQKAKQTELKRFIYAANIPLIGKTASEAIANELLSSDKLITEIQNKFVTVSNIKDFGPKMIESLNTNGATNFNILWAAGVKPTNVISKAKTVVTGKIKTFVITGSFEKGRKEIEQIIKDAGHKTSGSVSSKTTYLLAAPGEESSTKYTKATKLGTSIIHTLDELNNLINE